jgi:hypothetical protein
LKGSKPAPEAGLTTLQRLNLTFGAGCGTMMVSVGSGEVEIVVEDVEGYFDEHINLSPRDFEDVLGRIKNSVSTVVFDSIYDVIEEAIGEAMFYHKLAQ